MARNGFVAARRDCMKHYGGRGGKDAKATYSRGFSRETAKAAWRRWRLSLDSLRDPRPEPPCGRANACSAPAWHRAHDEGEPQGAGVRSGWLGHASGAGVVSKRRGRSGKVHPVAVTLLPAYPPQSSYG